MATNRFQIRAFFNQFPFLTVLKDKYRYDRDGQMVINPAKVEEVRVSRIDQNFLQTTPHSNGATGSCVGIEEWERILLLDEKGKLVIEVQHSGYVRHNEAHTDDQSWDGETVGEALLHLDNPNIVAYAVKVHTGYVIENHYSVGGFSVTLYKAPKGFSLLEWVQEQLRRAQEQITATLAEIDAEA